MAIPFQHRLAATALLAALALPALAQPAPATPPAAGATATAPAPAAKGQAKAKADHRERREAHRAQRMAALKEQLKLTPAQESAWATYTAALQPGERGARLDRQGMAQLTTPERIDRMRALRAQHAAEADRRGEATKAFYATLTPEQQKTFDAQAHHGHRMKGMKNHGEGRHGHRHGMRGADGQPREQQQQRQPTAPAT